jgi:uncharacterized repeat protein (TIGR03803 family)
MTNLRTYGLFTCVPTPSRKGSRMKKFGLLKRVCILLVVCGAMAIASPAQRFSPLFSFDSTDGAAPYAGLIQASDGNFYGTTVNGGANNFGTVFKITPSGTLTTLYSFCSGACANGGMPYAGLVQGTDGNFYGTTINGATSNNCPRGDGCGTVFQITPGGVLTTLYTFCAQTNCTDGDAPYAGLIRATDGNFYGTTVAGGASSNCGNGCGTVFEITAGGVLTTLHSFGGPDGLGPYAGLIQATDGNFYGTTYRGGASSNCGNGCGTVFEITPGGVLTTLHSFGGPDGLGPSGGLIQAADGNFYGTTSDTVFQMTPGGVLTTLHSFFGPDGAYPYGGLVQGTDGNFYGTTSAGGVRYKCRGCGTVFEITPGGVLTTLHSFGGPDGEKPYAGLVQATDANFYGTTIFGGANNYGTVFTFGPQAVKLPSAFGFGNQPLNVTSGALPVVLTNIGTAVLSISGVAITGNFAISANTCTGAVLTSGRNCHVSITFTPTALGKQTGKLIFNDDAANSPQTVPLSGTGVLPATLTPASATYAAQAFGTTSPAKTFTLTNNQTVALSGVTITTSGDFGVSSTTCTTSLAAKSKCTISVTFTPTATGTRKGQLSVSDDASNSSQTASLTGTGK